MTERSQQLRAGNPVLRESGRRNIAKAQAARWPGGPGPITHGTSTHMTIRCRAENDGNACRTCLDADARRLRERYARKDRP